MEAFVLAPFLTGNLPDVMKPGLLKKADWRNTSWSDACGESMRHVTALQQLQDLEQIEGIEAALSELQGVAESQWIPGVSRASNGRADPILGSMRSNPAAVKYYSAVAKDPSIRTICEVGYNWGASSLVWLHSNPRARVFSFDLFDRAYTNATYAWLNQRYNGRLKMIAGDSSVTIPTFANKHNRHVSCDLVIVDGDHSYEGELANARNFRKVARCGGSHYIMDDCDCTHRKNPITQAWAKAVQMGFIMPVAGHLTNALYKSSQTFHVHNEKHSFCAGVLKGSCVD